jgi:hypothetical protein
MNILSDMSTKASNSKGESLLIDNSFKQSSKLSIEGCSPDVVINVGALSHILDGSIFLFSFPFAIRFEALFVVQRRHVFVYPIPFFLNGNVSSSPLYAQLEHFWTKIVFRY